MSRQIQLMNEMDRQNTEMRLVRILAGPNPHSQKCRERGQSRLLIRFLESLALFGDLLL
jgi:hypothetical protein